MEANYHFAPLWHGLVRYDFVDSNDVSSAAFPDLFAQNITLQINHFHRLNLRFLSEVVFDPNEEDYLIRVGIDFDL